MIIVSKRQIEKMDEEVLKKFVAKVIQLLIKDFDAEKSEKLSEENELKLFIRRSIVRANQYAITQESSIIAYIVLSFLNGENFLETKDFKVYKHYLNKKFYDPNKYIFEIPNRNTR